MSRRAAFGQMILARVREFFREPEAIFWVYGFPLILAVVLGIAFSGGSKPEPPAVDVQGSPTDPVVTTLVKRLRAGGFKKVEVHTESEAKERLRTGKTGLVIVPEGKGLKYVYDETSSDAVLARYWVDSVLARSELSRTVPAPNEDFLKEPGSRYIDFLVPGLIGMNLMGGGLFGIGFVLVDMRVRKLFKRLLATPMNRTDFLLSLFTSRLLFMVPELLVLFGVGVLAFGVPIRGDPLTLLLVVLVGTAAFSGLGLLIASRTDKTETVSGLINLTMLPMYLLSGTFFSSTRFPDAIQPFIQALPLTQINDALREVMLEGHGLVEIGWRLGILAAWALATFLLALKWFRWR
jgi:ABC-type multidrug transport system permease subunit